MKQLFTLLLIMLPSFIFAQIPQLFSYQAVVRNGSEELLTDQSVGVRVSVIEGTEFGASIYVETQQGTTNANGLLTFQVGNGVVVLGDFATIDWGSNNYFIRTEIDPSGGTSYSINGTSQLLSVPYALASSTAQRVNLALNDLSNVSVATPSSNQVLTWNGSSWISGTANMALNDLSNVSAASPSSNESLIWNGSSWVSSALDLSDLGDVVAPAPSNNQILRYNAISSRWVPFTDQATPWSVNGTVINYNGGNVGIGTGLPTERLHVIGDVRVSADFIGAGDVDISGEIRFGNTERFYDGGLNTIETDDLMHFDSNGDFSNPHVRISEPGSAGVARLHFGNTVDPDEWRIVAQPRPAAAPEDALFGINYGADDIFTIKGDGRVGIGTNNPQSDLHIVQTAASPGLRLSQPGSGNRWNISYGFSNRLYFSFNGAETAYFTTAGTLVTPSDINRKEYIETLPDVLSNIMHLRPVSYQMKNGTLPNAPIGFIAQEVQKIFPNIVHVTNNEGQLALNYADFGVYAVKAIQEQQAQIESMFEQLAELREEIEKLKKSVE